MISSSASPFRVRHAVHRLSHAFCLSFPFPATASARYLFPRFRNKGNSVEGSGTMKRLLLVAGIAAVLVLTFEVTEASSESDSRSGPGETTPTVRGRRSPQDGPPKCPPPPMGPDGMPPPPPPDGMPPCGPPPNERAKRFAQGEQGGQQGGAAMGGGFGGGMGGGFGEAMANGMQTMTKAMGDMAKTAGNMMGGAMPGMG